MHYIKDIFNKNNTEHAHNKFIRYSKGVFVGPLLEVKLSKTQVKLKASFHFVDELLYLLAEVLGNKQVHIVGTLVWNTDLNEDLGKLGIKYAKVSKSRGIFKYDLDNDVAMKDFMDLMGKYHVLATIKTEEVSFVTKTSFPKPNKGFAADFCKVTLPGNFAKKFTEDFLFDVNEKNIKDVSIQHEIIVEDIELPNIDDFDKARRLAKRVGTIKRTIAINGAEPVVTNCKFKV